MLEPGDHLQVDRMPANPARVRNEDRINETAPGHILNRDGYRRSHLHYLRSAGSVHALEDVAQ